MSTQIFKNKIHNELFFNLLDLICIKYDKYYILTIESYKKGIFKEYIQNFISECKQYYHSSKQKYLERPICYNAFTTIIRQICKSNNIKYISQIKYNKSTYNIVYYIYF
jgi:hypothetical protein